MKGHRRKVLPLAPLTHQPDAIGASSLDFAGRSIGGPTINNIPNPSRCFKSHY